MRIYDKQGGFSKLSKICSKERSAISSKQQKVVPKGAQCKFFCSKVVPKGMQSLQRKINADSAEVKGEEAPKGGL